MNLAHQKHLSQKLEIADYLVGVPLLLSYLLLFMLLPLKDSIKGELGARKIGSIQRGE